VLIKIIEARKKPPIKIKSFKKVQNLLPTGVKIILRFFNLRFGAFWHFSVLNLAFSAHWHLATLSQIKP
jgi:hypothetical protein